MTIATTTEVSIIIVNYNAGPYLRNCIESIQSQKLTKFQIIVIDNASVDGSLYLLPKDNRIAVYRNNNNEGFAKAQNQGMRLANGRYIMPMNFDILLAPDFLSEMITAIDCAKGTGSVAPKIMRMNESGIRTTQIDNAGILLPKNFYPHERGRGEQDHGQYDKPMRVFSTTGAVALYRREMLEDIAYKGQYFDEKYFMWYEDIDLEWRARLRGWDCLYNPMAVAYHVGDPHGHNRSKFGAQVSIRNRWMMVLSNGCSGCLIRNTSAILGIEFGLINHVIRKGLVSAYLKAIGSIFKQLPEILQKRHWVHNQAKISCLPEFPLPL